MKTDNIQRKQTNWYVVTGGPGSGKTTTINILAERGYKTTIEHARHYIDTQRQNGRTVEEARRNQEEFQMGILDMQVEQEASLFPGDMVLRIFDTYCRILITGPAWFLASCHGMMTLPHFDTP